MSNKWDARFMELAQLVALWSKDRSRKTGAVIVSTDRSILSTGFNGFPRGVNDDASERHERPAKYRWTEHAERNAIYGAAKHGVLLQGSTMYLSWYPCMDCARAIIQSGIKYLVCIKPDWDDPIWKQDFADVAILLKEGEVLARFAEGSAPEMQ